MDSGREVVCSIPLISHLCYFAAPLMCQLKNCFLQVSCKILWGFQTRRCVLDKKELLTIRSGRSEGRGEEYFAVYNGDCMWSQVTLHFCPEATHVLLVLNSLKTCVSRHLSFENTLWNTIFSCWAFYLFTADRQKRVKIVLECLAARLCLRTQSKSFLMFYPQQNGPCSVGVFLLAATWFNFNLLYSIWA